MAVFSFEDLLEAKQWALDTQKGRRNLEKWELGKIALKLKPEIEAKARANQGTRTDPVSYTHLDVYKRQASDAGHVRGHDPHRLCRPAEQLPRPRRTLDAGIRSNQ